MTQYAIEKIGYGAYCCMNAHVYKLMFSNETTGKGAY